MLTGQIARDPGDAGLYLKRAGLHRLRGAAPAALADYDRALALEPDLDEVYFDRAETLRESGRFGQALSEYDRFLARHPRHPTGLRGRGLCLVRVGRLEEGARDYVRALRAAARPSPDNYLEASRVYDELGAEHLDASLAVLDEGLARLGPIVSLQHAAIDREVRRGNYEAALQRVDTLLALPGRPERSLVRKADILAAAGRTRDAHALYDDVLQRLARRLSTPAGTPLDERLAARVRLATKGLPR